MATQQSQVESSSVQSTNGSKRADMACLLCRGRKSKCELLERLPEPKCRRCDEKGNNCKYMSVADEEKMKNGQVLAHESSVAGPAIFSDGVLSSYNLGIASPGVELMARSSILPASSEILLQTQTAHSCPFLNGDPDPLSINPANPVTNEPYSQEELIALTEEFFLRGGSNGAGVLQTHDQIWQPSYLVTSHPDPHRGNTEPRALIGTPAPVNGLNNHQNGYGLGLGESI